MKSGIYLLELCEKDEKAIGEERVKKKKEKKKAFGLVLFSSGINWGDLVTNRAVNKLNV